MTKKRTLLTVLLCLAFFSHGVAVGVYEVFPYHFIQTVKNTYAPTESQKNLKGIDAVKLFEYFSPKADVAFVGDSITYRGRWGEFFPSLRVVNRGIGSDRTSDIVLRIDSILSTDPHKALIMVGINDVHQNISTPEILRNYELIIRALVKANVEVGVQSTIQCEVSICGVKHVNSVNDLNKALVQLASQNGAIFLSLGELSDSTGLSSKYTSDGIHLTAEGYIYWVRKIENFLKA